jgi:hypothetical protein
MSQKVMELMDAVLTAWTKCLMPPYGTGDYSAEIDKATDCNRFVNDVASQLGYKKFGGLRANEMYDFLTNNKQEWIPCEGQSAAHYAAMGLLVIAAWKNPDATKSGHVAVVLPGKCVGSNKWGVPHASPTVPKVANVGAPERCRLDRGANYAFGDQPTYFVMKKETEPQNG